MHKHTNFGDAISGNKLIGYATKIFSVSSNNPFKKCCQLKFKKTRGRNSECFIDLQLKLNQSDNNRLKPYDVKQYPTTIKNYFENIGKIGTPKIVNIYTQIDDCLIGDILIGCCDSFGKITMVPKKHDHNCQMVKFEGNPDAICFIDTPLDNSSNIENYFELNSLE